MSLPTRGVTLLAARLCLSAPLTVSCLAPAQDNDGGTNGAATGASSESVPTEGDSEPPCKLTETTDNPQVTLSGRLCGETISLTTRAGALIHLGRSQPTDPESEVRLIEVLDNNDPATASDLASAEFLINLAFETGPEVASSVSSHNLVSGVFSLCGFGTVVMLSGPVTFDMSGVEDGETSGDVTLTLSGMLVGGFSATHGQDRVQVCGGELDLTLRGRFLHQ